LLNFSVTVFEGSKALIVLEASDLLPGEVASNVGLALDEQLELLGSERLEQFA
jgi:hypothetical protein